MTTQFSGDLQIADDLRRLTEFVRSIPQVFVTVNNNLPSLGFAVRGSNLEVGSEAMALVNDWCLRNKTTDPSTTN